MFFKEISFYKSEFIQIISNIKSRTPTLPPHLPKSYVSEVSCAIQLEEVNCECAFTYSAKIIDPISFIGIIRVF